MDSWFVRSASEPFARRLRHYLLWSAGLTALFLATYSATNAFAAGRAERYRLYAPWELQLPFVPWMIYVYCSVNAFLMLPVLVLNSRGIHRFGAAFAGLTLAGAAAHAAFPAEFGWQRPASVPGYPLFDIFYQLDKPHNLTPSLHVAYSGLAAAVLWRAGGGLLRSVALVWCLLLTVSVVLVRQHHVLDVVTGAACAVVAYGWFSGGKRKV